MIAVHAESSPGEVRIAVVQDGVLLDYALWRPGAPDGVGDVYRGRITAVVPAMAGAFVALGEQEGFLPDSEGARGLSEGSVLTVRITRAAQGGKGPRLTAKPSSDAPSTMPSPDGPSAKPSLNAASAKPSLNALSAMPSLDALSAMPSLDALSAKPSLNAASPAIPPSWPGVARPSTSAAAVPGTDLDDQEAPRGRQDGGGCGDGVPPPSRPATVPDIGRATQPTGTHHRDKPGHDDGGMVGACHPPPPDANGAAPSPGAGSAAGVPASPSRAAPDGRSAASAPGLLQRGADPLREFARRYPDAPIIVDDPALAAELRPSLGGRISLAAPAFPDSVADAIGALDDPTVALPGGARMTIFPTPALVAIDVDAGGSLAAGGGKASRHVAVNQAILPALAAQIRLRNLSGAIVVDLAGLSVRKRTALGPALAQALAADPLQPRFLGFTALGLAEIVRPRRRPPLHELLAGPHAAGLAALRRIAADLDPDPRRLPALRAAPAVVEALQRDTAALPDLTRRIGRSLTLRADPSLPATGWRLEPEHA